MIEWRLEWAPHIYRNPNKPHKKMLEMHPVPFISTELGLVLRALDQMQGDRLNNTSKIPYQSKKIWMDVNIPISKQDIFIELLDYADVCHVIKVQDLQNREVKKQEKQNGRSI